MTNNQCEAWKSYNMPFFICPAGTGCRLRDQEMSIDFYPNPATDRIVLQGLDHIHPGDRIEATIVDVIGKVVKRIPHLQKTQITVSDLNSGMYYLSVFRNPSSGSVPNGAYVFIDDVLIEAFNPLPDTILLCDQQPIHLNAGFHNATYQWNTGERDSMITVSRSGKYRVSAMIDTLEFVDSTTVIYMNEFSNHTSIDTFFCQGSELVLRPPIPGRSQWHNGNTESIRTVQDAGTYPLTVENECGTYRFTYEISERDCDCDLVFPTAFSPNGDNRNDYFMVIDQCRYRAWTLESFRVYDKWGGKVYEESGPSVNWDGQGSDGRRISPGVYTYRLEVNFREGSREESILKTGSVQLLR